MMYVLRYGKKIIVFFYNCSIYVDISRFVYDICNYGGKKRFPRRTHRVSHVKSRVCKRLIIYPFSDLFNRHSLKFIEGYLRNAEKSNEIH